MKIKEIWGFEIFWKYGFINYNFIKNQDQKKKVWIC